MIGQNFNFCGAPVTPCYIIYLILIFFSGAADAKEICAICLSSIDDPELSTIRLTCGHQLHVSCMAAEYVYFSQKQVPENIARAVWDN